MVVGRVLAVKPLPPQPAAHGDPDPPDLSHTRLIVEQDDLVCERVLVHLQPIELPLHRSLTLVTGWEAEREWLLYVYIPGDKSHRRFDEHIRWFFNRQGADDLGEADIRLLWSTVLLQVLPSGAL